MMLDRPAVIRVSLAPVSPQLASASSSVPSHTANAVQFQWTLCTICKKCYASPGEVYCIYCDEILDEKFEELMETYGTHEGEERFENQFQSIKKEAGERVLLNSVRCRDCGKFFFGVTSS